MIDGNKYRELLYRDGIFRNINNRTNSRVSEWGNRLRIGEEG